MILQLPPNINNEEKPQYHQYHYHQQIHTFLSVLASVRRVYHNRVTLSNQSILCAFFLLNQTLYILTQALQDL